MRLGFVLFFICLLQWANGQTYHRTFLLNDDEQIYNIATTTTNDDGYVTLNGVLKDSTFKHVYFVKHDNKGTLKWVKSIKLLANDSLEFVPTLGNIFQAENDSLYFTLDLVLEDEPNRLVGALSDNGEGGWSYLVDEGRMRPQVGGGFNRISDYFDGSFIQLVNIGDDVDYSTILNTISYEGDLLSSQELNASFQGDALSLSPFIVKTAEDSSIMMSGIVNEASLYYLTVLDKEKDVKINKLFIDTVNFFSITAGLDVEQTRDTGYLVSGQYIVPDLSSQDSLYLGSFISKHDSLGNLEWAKRVNVGKGIPQSLTHIIVNDDNTIMITGSITRNGELYQYLLKLDENGNQIWGKLYDRVQVLFGYLGDFLPTMDGGYLISNTAFVNNALPGINVMKVDNDGVTTCESILEDMILEDAVLVEEDFDLRISSNETIALKDANPRYETLMTDVFAVPEITLETRFFCPNEPIDWTFDASITGATKYEWNTGDTTATLRVTDTEEYTVTVTINVGECYVLCDTAQLDRYELPSASGSYNCIGNDMYTLTVNPNADAGVDSIIWSTGAFNVNQITVSGQGTYTVTVIDNCGEAAMATINVDPPVPTLSPSYQCREDGIYILSNFPPNLTEAISWSTGASSNGQHEVLIPAQGQYSLTITDICNETATANINVDPPTPNIDGIYTCREEGILLSFDLRDNNNVPPLDITWSTGQKDTVITVLQQGSYTVTVTDLCRETVSEIINVDPPTPNLSVMFTCVENGIELEYLINNNVGVLSSIWSTGSQDDNKNKILVSQEGSYSVTVTDFCRETATATSNVQTSNPVFTVVEAGCNPQGQTYRIDRGGSQQAVFTEILWSTGSQDNGKDSVLIATPGNYTVTITNLCGKTTVVNFEVPPLPDELTLSKDLSGACGDNPGQVSVAFNGVSNAIQWSTGSTSNTAEVFEPGIYAVTVTDKCNNILTASITVNAEEFPFEVESVTILRSDNCDDNTAQLTAQVIGRNRGIEWSTGSTENTITVPVEGQLITLVAKDDCGNKQDSEEVSNPFEECIAFANIFFPEKTAVEEMFDAANNEFGGYLRSGTDPLAELCMDFTALDYTLKVYNRFGQEVFTSDDFDDRWKGFIKGDESKPAPPAVYVWYAEWSSQDGCRFTRKGDITLFR